MYKRKRTLILLFLLVFLVFLIRLFYNKSPSLKSHKLCVLVPFRNRWEELNQFIPHMSSFLRSQFVSHDFIVVQQGDNYRFNRASLLNVGFLQSSSHSCDYIALHDVDLLPDNSELSYDFPSEGPMHISAPGLHPLYGYPSFFGGIVLITSKHFVRVNGMSNNYWGWGLEDDEFLRRLQRSNIPTFRPLKVKTSHKNTFKHVHGPTRTRDNKSCYNQRDICKYRDKFGGLHSVKYSVLSAGKKEIKGIKYNYIDVELHCNNRVTPWCDCDSKYSGPLPTIPPDFTNEDIIMPKIKRRKSSKA